MQSTERDWWSQEDTDVLTPSPFGLLPAFSNSDHLNCLEFHRLETSSLPAVLNIYVSNSGFSVKLIYLSILWEPISVRCFNYLLVPVKPWDCAVISSHVWSEGHSQQWEGELRGKPSLLICQFVFLHCRPCHVPQDIEHPPPQCKCLLSIGAQVNSREWGMAVPLFNHLMVPFPFDYERI